LIHVTYVGDDLTEHALRCTDEHPLWVANRSRIASDSTADLSGEWVPAKDLVAGDRLIGPKGQAWQVTAVSRQDLAIWEPVYNFTVEHDHTYFVAPEGDPTGVVLTHNSPRCRVKHHTIPSEIQDKLPEHLRNDPDIVGRRGLPNKKPVDADKHAYEIHDRTGISPTATGIYGGKYNLRFQEEIMKRGGYESITKQQLLEIRDLLVKEFGI